MKHDEAYMPKGLTLWEVCEIGTRAYVDKTAEFWLKIRTGWRHNITGDVLPRPLDNINYVYDPRRDNTYRGFTYRLTRMGGDSHKYGNCEVCGKHADSVYSLSQGRRYHCTAEEVKYYGMPEKAIGDGITYYQCHSWFGHRECLIKKTELYV